MDQNDLKKYAVRAGEVLAKFAAQKLKEVKPVDKAVEEFIESQKNLKYIEAKFNANSIEIIYNYLKQKYKKIDFPERTDKLIKALKIYAEKKNDEATIKAKLIYSQIVEDIKEIEKKIVTIDHKYVPKFI